MKRLIFDLKARVGARSSLQLAEELQTHERWTPEQLEMLSRERAITHARFAMAESPFYRDLYADAGFTLADLDDPAVFDSLPIIEKQQVRENFDRIKTTEATSATSVVSSSGGSTGEPLQLLRDLRVPVRAVEWRLFRWWGVNPWDHRGDLYRQILVGSAKRKHDLQWWPSRRLHLNARNMTDETIRAFVDEWNSYHPSILVGYVGGVLELSRAVSRLGLHFEAPTAIALTAAPLPDGVRREIEQSLGGQVYDHYRSAEIPWMAGECRAHSGMHVFTDMRRIEIIGADGKPVSSGTSGEVVATDTTNRVFPLIRYRLGDVTRYLDGPCACGVTLPRIAPVAGRVVEVLRVPDGGVIPGESLTGIFAPTPHAVRQFQLVQAADYSVVLRCVRGDSPGADAEIAAAAQMVSSIGRGAFPVRYEIVDTIPHVAGKTRFILSDAPA